MARSSRVVFPALRLARSRLVEQRHVRERLVSVAGLIARPVRLGDGRDVGRVVDVVVAWSGESYPPVTGVVVRVGRRRAFVPIGDVSTFAPAGVTLSSPRLDVRDFESRPGEVALMSDVVDHQLVDIDGVQVVRAADLYLADVAGSMRLVGVEIGVVTLLRRLGPARWRAVATPERVIDWADVQPVGTGMVRLERANRELRRLRPGDLADLLEELGHPQRQELVSVLDAEIAADALEEMDEIQRDQLLRRLDPARSAAILAEMEPDEAAEALRDLTAQERAALLEHLPADTNVMVDSLLGYAAYTAGGIMTTVLAVAHEDDVVSAVINRLRDLDAHRADIDAVLVLSRDGRLVDDVSIFELAIAAATQSMAELVGPPWPIVLRPEAELDEIVDAALSNRRSSIVVVDADDRPLGRILTDDVLDALTPSRGWFRRDVGDQ